MAICYYPRKVKDVLLRDVIHPSRSLLPEPSSLCCGSGKSTVLAVGKDAQNRAVLALAEGIGTRGVPQSAWHGWFSEPPLVRMMAADNLKGRFHWDDHSYMSELHFKVWLK